LSIPWEAERGVVMGDETIKSTVKYDCGCGLSTKDLHFAVDHVEKTGHAITVTGMIRPTKK